MNKPNNDEQTAAQEPNVKKDKNKKLFIVLFLMGALILFGFIAISISFEEDAPLISEIENTGTPPATARVTITENNMLPGTISIDVGTQVTFTNESDKSVELKSSDANTLELDSFNVDEKLTNSSTYSYIFETEGEYVVHTASDPENQTVLIKVGQ